jgi:hypothetical protein
MAAWSRLREGSGIDERCAGLGPGDIELQGEHLHYDRAARTWRTHAELAETPPMGMSMGAAAGAIVSDTTRMGVR